MMAHSETAVLAVPLKDHFGQVIGVLHATGKQRARTDQMDVKQPRAKLKQMETCLDTEELDTPIFTTEDEEFLRVRQEAAGAHALA